MLTLSDVTERVADDEAGRRPVSRKIQNWVIAGLVHPTGGTGQGRGVHRTYDLHEMRKIAVLLELERFDLRWSVLLRVAHLFDDRRGNRNAAGGRTDARLGPGMPRGMRALFDRAVDGAGAVHLILRPGIEEMEVTVADGLGGVAGARSAVIVNLTEVLRPFQGRD